MKLRKQVNEYTGTRERHKGKLSMELATRTKLDTICGQPLILHSISQRALDAE